MQWTDAQIAAVGSVVVGLLLNVATVFLMMRKSKREDDGTTIGQWRALCNRKDNEVASLKAELTAERTDCQTCRVEMAALKSENRHLRTQLYNLGHEPTPPETPWLPGNPDRRRDPKSGKHYHGPRRREDDDETAEAEEPEDQP